ncbi:type I restriction endonuclease subunit R [Halorhodospira halophila]|uniref:type I restriction endonuclease subunit R n=1 Tax=Halorhodospira halophila TaxID=1053 RepID=UPI001914A123|nr:HsdR family type I site-specific deoxyribonuclease [Halorhodospira halophila]MBK5944756.1 restriction endonuclease subunit R [Halorhodospira halophila]
MSDVGQLERLTQQQVLQFFLDTLGYRYLGDWTEREGNRPIEPGLLADWLHRRGHDDRIIDRALRELDQAAALSGSKTLYEANRAVYERLRYGVKAKRSVEEQNETVWLVDWAHPENNDFAVAEEVTVIGKQTKRPDVVLYVNGVAFGVLELKRATVAAAEGIRQNLLNQDADVIRSFFAPVQLLMAGNATEGLYYGVIDTPEKYWLQWQEETPIEDPLLAGLEQLCRKDRLLEIVHDFIVFDAGTKKTCRHNQYFGVRAAQDYVRRREGGVIWHTQGSGKSLTMVWLAKWIREHVTNARVLVVTDRKELDEQIEAVFKGVSEHIHRTRSGEDLIDVLGRSEPWLIGSLVHKFGTSEEGDVDAFIQDVESQLPKGFKVRGEVFVFVDECHRTQSGKLHAAMKQIVPGAMLIGFTGTPLLKKDKPKSIETFGPYIHTYKYDQAVRDGVVLDLSYEARDIDQQITNQKKIDEWFEVKTQGLTDYARAQLKQRWGSLQKVLSSQDRLQKIVADILWDMETRDRLMSRRGNAMLVAGSIYAACRLYEMFQKTELKGHCAVVTSYVPSTASIKNEVTGEGETEKLHQYEVYRQMLAEHFDEPAETAINKVETFEEQVKQRFIHQPAQMRLLIVVDKLLTGFDAPPATYLYIDKQMRDHGLFQAICRVNRLHTEDKEVGYVIDYKDLFRSLEQSIQDYTGGAFDAFEAGDVEGLLQERLSKAQERLEEAREAVKALCEAVEPPGDSAAYRRYFVGSSNDPAIIKDNEPKRVALYKQVGALLRAYANLANEMQAAGYSAAEAETVRHEVEYAEKVREEVKLASGDYVDMKVYEPAMRHLLDTYIRADESRTLAAFDDKTLVELIVERGEEATESLPDSVKGDQEAMAETIENNVRRLIIDERDVNPKYYDRMSELLDALIEKRRQDALQYQEYLQQVVQLARDVTQGQGTTDYPPGIDSPARKSLYDNLGQDAELAVTLDSEIRQVKRADWRGNPFKERRVRNAIESVLKGHDSANAGFDVDAVLELVKAQNDY